LTLQLAAKWMKGLLLHLTRLDDEHTAVEADLSKQRGENCDMAAFNIYMARKRPDVTAADIYLLDDLQQCFCDASDDTTAGCLAYADVIANRTANAYQETSNGAGTSRRAPAAGSRSAALTTGDEQQQQQQGNHNRRRVLAAAAADPAPLARMDVAASADVVTVAAGVVAAWQGGTSDIQQMDPWSVHVVDGSQLTKLTGVRAGTQFICYNCFCACLRHLQGDSLACMMHVPLDCCSSVYCAVPMSQF
jgi:hypothetical protein